MRKQRSRYKDAPDKFIAWSKAKDIDGIGWEFKEGDKLYYPIGIHV